MNSRKGLVLDANILLRPVFAARVRRLLESCEDVARFCSPGVCFGEAQEYLSGTAQNGERWILQLR